MHLASQPAPLRATSPACSPVLAARQPLGINSGDLGGPEALAALAWPACSSFPPGPTCRLPCCAPNTSPAVPSPSSQFSPCKTSSTNAWGQARGPRRLFGDGGAPAGSPTAVADQPAYATASQPSSATSSLAEALADLQVSSRQSSAGDLGDRSRILAFAAAKASAAPAAHSRSSSGDELAGLAQEEGLCATVLIGAVRCFDSMVLKTLTPIKTRSRASSHDGAAASPPVAYVETLVSPFGGNLKPKGPMGRPVVYHSRGSSGMGAPGAYNPYDLTAAALSSGARPGRARGASRSPARAAARCAAAAPRTRQREFWARDAPDSPRGSYWRVCPKVAVRLPGPNCTFLARLLRPPAPRPWPLPDQGRPPRLCQRPPPPGMSTVPSVDLTPYRTLPPFAPAEFRSPAKSMYSPYPSSSRTASASATPNQWGSGSYRGSAYRAAAQQQAMAQVRAAAAAAASAPARGVLACCVHVLADVLAAALHRSPGPFRPLLHAPVPPLTPLLAP